MVDYPVKPKRRHLPESPSEARRFIEKQAMRDMYPEHPGRKPLRRKGPMD